MKKSVVKCGIIAVTTAVLLCSCIKIHEDVSEERIGRPEYDIDMSNPAWKPDDNGTDAGGFEVGK